MFLLCSTRRMSSGFTSMSERHAFGLEALAEMTGKLVQAAYKRAIEPVDPEDQDRAILLFDRLARGFRLTLALEARLDRDRRRDAAALDASTQAPAQRLAARTSSASPAPYRPREDDVERDADLEPADLPTYVRDLRRVVAEDADILDPDGAHARTIDRWDGVWGDVVYDTPPPDPEVVETAVKPPHPVRALLRQASRPPPPPRRASG
jgi:hypothetical protein